MSEKEGQSNLCIDCKENVIFFYRSYFCEDCIRDFFNDPKVEKEKSE